MCEMYYRVVYASSAFINQYADEHRKGCFAQGREDGGVGVIRWLPLLSQRTGLPSTAAAHALSTNGTDFIFMLVDCD